MYRTLLRRRQGNYLREGEIIPTTTYKLGRRKNCESIHQKRRINTYQMTESQPPADASPPESSPPAPLLLHHNTRIIGEAPAQMKEAPACSTRESEFLAEMAALTGNYCGKRPVRKEVEVAICRGSKHYDVQGSKIVNTLDGLFGFGNVPKTEVAFPSMTDEAENHVGKQGDRVVARDTWGCDKAVAMDRLAKVLQHKAYCRFRNVREAFRLVDLDKSGRVDRSEMRGFFSQFNLSDASADLFFDSLGPNENDEIDYVVFMNRFGSIVLPGAYATESATQEHAQEPRNLVYGPGWLRKLG
ncbi:unnamed protein product [Amoebophrya sp. A25]|nr:unnamed protein product [Amoebophrya sp. A25]|eukprot:GSA25T00000918001.1